MKVILRVSVCKNQSPVTAALTSWGTLILSVHKANLHSLERTQRDMRSDKRFRGCPNLLVLRGVENFPLVTGGELKLLQGRKGRN